MDFISSAEPDERSEQVRYPVQHEKEISYFEASMYIILFIS